MKNTSATSISLKYVLYHRNCAGEIYSCDIDRWLGITIPSKKRDELKKILEKIGNQD